MKTLVAQHWQPQQMVLAGVPSASHPTASTLKNQIWQSATDDGYPWGN
jgi:hypothetical protein